jgi:hypothetical protein
MNAVTFMDAMRPGPAAAAPPPKRPQRRLSPNAALIATIGTLLLAMGVGVLIGHAGNQSTTSAPAAPQVIEVGGGSSSAGTGAGAETGKTTTGGESSGAKKQPKALEKEAESQTGAEEFLKPSAGAKPLAKPNQKLGGSCEKGTAGCSKSGKFEGNFFGEE